MIGSALGFALRTWLRRTLLALGSLTCCAAALELAVRWHVEGSLAAALRSFAGFQGQSEVRTDGTWFVSDPELGYRFDPLHEGINAFGMHERSIAEARESGALRVLVLGDSVAWEDGGFVDLLRPRLRDARGAGVELLNASIPGYTAWQEQAFYRRDLARLKPGLVLWQYCLNDNHRLLHRLDAEGNRLLTPEAKRALIPEGDSAWGRLTRWSYLAVEVRRRMWARELSATSRFPWDSREDLCTAWRRESWIEYESNLRALRDALAATGARLAVVAVPIEEQLSTKLLTTDRNYVLLPQRELAQVCARHGVPLLDLHAPFLAAVAGAGAPRLYTDGLHLSAAGHALAASEIQAFVERSGLLAVPPGAPLAAPPGDH